MGKKNSSKSSVLVKWVNIAVWDTIKAELAFKEDPKLGELVNSDPKSYIGKVFDFFWIEGESKSAGELLGYGNLSELESKRSNLIKSHYEVIGEVVPEEIPDEEPTSSQTPARSISGPREIQGYKEKQQQNLMKNIISPVSAASSSEELALSEYSDCSNDSLKQKYNSLREKYEKLKAQHKRDKAEIKNLKDEKSVMAQLKDLVRQLETSKQRRSADPMSCEDYSTSFAIDNSGLNDSQIPTSQRYEIAPGIIMDKGMLATLLRVSPNATKFARALLLNLFTTEELINSSLSGKSSNAHPDKVAKKGLDIKRIDAIIDYTLKKFPSSTRREVHGSLANKIKELTNSNKHTLKIKLQAYIVKLISH